MFHFTRSGLSRMSTKDATLRRALVQLRTGAPWRRGEEVVELRREQHAEHRSGEVNLSPVHTPLGRADATVRAGLMLMPESGASKVMYRKTSVPANNPVKRASFGVLVRNSTISIMPQAIAASAMNATPTPTWPGTVVTSFTEGCAMIAPSSTFEKNTPEPPPMNCAEI